MHHSPIKFIYNCFKLLKINISFLFKSFLFIILGFHFFIIIFAIIFSILFSYINPPISSLMIYRKLFYNYTNKPVKFIPLKKIPYDVRRMLIKTEDCNFYKHNGIDFKAMQNALKINKRIGYNLFGGSTLTQQIARTLYLFPKKYIIRKYIEIIIALIMDLIMPKDRILELYFNYVEWGKGIYGIEKASNIYFKKSSKYLTFDEGARLITILSSPINYNPYNFFIRKDLAHRYDFICGNIVENM